MAVAKRQDEDKTELGCAMSVGIVGYGILGILLLQALAGGDIVSTFLITGAVVVCTALFAGANVLNTKMKLQEVHRQRILEENRLTEIRHKELEERRMQHELEMAKLKALPAPKG